MKLMKMTLNNFQGIKALEMNFNGKDAEVRGANGTGKTTIANAQAWLLTGKSSNDEKGFMPKTEGASRLEHSVECSYSTPEGIVTLKKTLKEKWTKKRGALTEEFTGHVIEYFKDGVPLKEKEFNDYIQRIAGDQEKIQMLTNSAYFARSMDWKKRREVLIQMTGEISDADIINNTPELKDLKTILLIPGTADQFHSVEDYMKMAKEQKKKTNAQIDAIPARIDEASRSIPNTSGMDKTALSANLAQIKETIKSFETELNGLNNTNVLLQQKQKKVDEIRARISSAKVAYLEQAAAARGDKDEALAAARTKQTNINLKMMSNNNTITILEQTIEQMEKDRETLIAQYKDVQQQEWSGDTTCPTCGQAFPEAKIEALKAKFNLNKSKQLEEINAKGQTVSAEKIKLEKEKLEAAKKEVEALGTDLILQKQEVQRLQEELQAVTFGAFETTEQHAALQKELNAALSIDTENELHTFEKERLMIQIQEAQQEEQTIMQQIAALELAAAQEKRIEELKQEHQALAAQYEIIERHIWTCEQFIKAKVKTITESINNCFKGIQFKLFETQINGGIKECCELIIPTTAGLVTYSNANTAARINAGLEVIDALQKHYSVELPVFVDNAESVTDLKEIDAQVIKLVVDKEAKELTGGETNGN